MHLLATTCFDLLYKNNGKGTIPVDIDIGTA